MRQSFESKSLSRGGRRTKPNMTQSLKIKKGEKLNFLDVAKQLDDAQLTNDQTLSTAGKTLDNTSMFNRTANT